MLNRIRVGEQTVKDMEILEKRVSSLLSKQEYDDAIHFFFTNFKVNEHNTCTVVIKTLHTVTK